MRNLSCVSSDFTATHSLPVKDYPHQHTWIVTVYWPSEPWRDDREVMKSLNGLLSLMRGEYLPGLTQEMIAQKALQLDGIVKSVVWRQDDCIGCEAWK